MTGFVAGDITVGNGTASDVHGDDRGQGVHGDRNHADGTNGAVTVDVAVDVATDAVGNGNTAATQVSSTYTMPVPTITIVGGHDARHRGRVGGLHADPVRGPPG